MPQAPRTPIASFAPSSSLHNVSITPQEEYPTPTAKRRPSPAPWRSYEPSKRPEPKRAFSTPPEVIGGDSVRSLQRGTPGDLPSANTLQKSWERQQLSKQRSQYFSDVFAYREPEHNPKERISRESVVIAELKLSGALDENTSLVSDLSFQLAQTFQRPESSIVLTVQDKTVLLFGGSFEPAYLLSVTALSSEIAPSKNKRTTALIQEFLQETTGIAANRGVIRFTPIDESNLGTNGLTALAQMEGLGKGASDDHSSIAGSLVTRNGSKRSRKMKKPTLTPPMEVKSPPNVLTPPQSQDNSPDESLGGPNISVAPSAARKQVKRRKSFMAFFRATG